ncbi:MAG: hypothetical protein II206_08200, partial [Bacteroidaceae bacterium]|nr:hypothetical protein [Bacteroidaceae bacterium]
VVSNEPRLFVILTIPYSKKIKDVFDERRRITCLTLFNLLTLGKIQASLSLLSLNRKFQDLSAEKDKKRLAVRC